MLPHHPRGAPRNRFGAGVLCVPQRLKRDPEKWVPVFGKDHAPARSVIPKSGYRFSEKITLQQRSVIPKSGYRFSEKITLQQWSVLPKSGVRFSEKIMLQ